MEGLALRPDPNVLAGIEMAEDAGVYKLNDDLAIIQTLDFFTPIVDDPYTFGQVAMILPTRYTIFILISVIRKNLNLTIIGTCPAVSVLRRMSSNYM